MSDQHRLEYIQRAFTGLQPDEITAILADSGQLELRKTIDVLRHQTYTAHNLPPPMISRLFDVLPIARIANHRKLLDVLDQIFDEATGTLNFHSGIRFREKALQVSEIPAQTFQFIFSRCHVTQIRLGQIGLMTLPKSVPLCPHVQHIRLDDPELPIAALDGLLEACPNLQEISSSDAIFLNDALPHFHARFASGAARVVSAKALEDGSKILHIDTAPSASHQLFRGLFLVSLLGAAIAAVWDRSLLPPLACCLSLGLVASVFVGCLRTNIWMQQAYEHYYDALGNQPRNRGTLVLMAHLVTDYHPIDAHHETFRREPHLSAQEQILVRQREAQLTQYQWAYTRTAYTEFASSTPSLGLGYAAPAA